ncbi:hypothetical protein Z951_36085 [Streptomyces sp. PRh5]|uniref:hypothetical protein n=1 Tax=Streptomyces sp. PRh5 TaxID=1158056 RepID=UPI00044B83F4|nr:hypothetical protein [Streptomyces sp. PRh5]EXU63414.1 hypothetical protein Z951_36085 [Streptomyces sp. PRh5]
MSCLVLLTNWAGTAYAWGSTVIVGLAAAVLALGPGLSQQVTVVASQSAVEVRDIGAATATVTFTRMLGTSIGASVFGVILNNGLADRVSELGHGATPTPCPAASSPPCHSPWSAWSARSS